MNFFQLHEQNRLADDFSVFQGPDSIPELVEWQPSHDIGVDFPGLEKLEQSGLRLGDVG